MYVKSVLAKLDNWQMEVEVVANSAGYYIFISWHVDARFNIIINSAKPTQQLKEFLHAFNDFDV